MPPPRNLKSDGLQGRVEGARTEPPWSATKQACQRLRTRDPKSELSPAERQAILAQCDWSAAYWEGQDACQRANHLNPYGDRLTQGVIEGCEIKYDGWETGFEAACRERVRRIQGGTA